YADWLEERGDPRGEFIRTQCQLARFPEGDPRRDVLKDREADLLAAHGSAWRAALPELPYGHWGDFVRGLVEEAPAYHAADFLALADRLFAVTPLRHLRIVRLKAADVAPLTAHPGLANLTELELHGEEFGPEGARLLAASPHAANLTGLTLSQA